MGNLAVALPRLHPRWHVRAARRSYPGTGSHSPRRVERANIELSLATSTGRSMLRVSRSYRISDEGVIEARETAKTFTAAAEQSDVIADVGSTSTTRSTLTLRALSRPLSDPVRRELACAYARTHTSAAHAIRIRP